MLNIIPRTYIQIYTSPAPNPDRWIAEENLVSDEVLSSERDGDHRQ